ncbi:12828_t:CDS:2, partial [Cetraspora pellucida]
KELAEKRQQKEGKVEENVKENVWMNVEEDFEVNIERDVEVNVEEDVETNVEKDAKINIEVNVVINAKEDVEVNVVINAEKAVEVDIKKKAEEEIVQDLEKDSELNIEEDNKDRNNEDEKTHEYLLTVTPIYKIKEKRHKCIFTNTAKGTYKVTSFFKAANASSINEVLPITAYEGINQLYEYLVKNGCLITVSKYNKCQVVYEYLVLLKSRYRKEEAKIWIPDENMSLQKKGNRRSIMVSKLLLEECSQLKLSEEEARMHPNISIEACYYLMPGKTKKFSNAIAVFAFDNSTNHGAYAEDALIAARINLKPEGNQPKIFEEDKDYDENM